MMRFPYRRSLAGLLSACMVFAGTTPACAQANPVSMVQIGGGAAVPTPIQVRQQQQQTGIAGGVEGIAGALTSGQPIGFKPQGSSFRPDAASRTADPVEALSSDQATDEAAEVERVAAALRPASYPKDPPAASLGAPPSDDAAGTGSILQAEDAPSAGAALSHIPEIVASPSVQAAAERLDRLYSGALRPAGAAPVVLRGTSEAGIVAGAPRSDRAKKVKVAETTPHGTPSFDYIRMFDLARRLLTRPQARQFLKEIFKEELTVSEEVQKEFALPDRIKDVSTSQFMLLLQYSSEHWRMLYKYLDEVADLPEDDKRLPELRTKWRKSFRELFRTEELKKTFLVLNDPLKPLHLKQPGGKPGYKSVSVHANHVTIVDGKEVAAEDLKQVALAFIAGAKKEIMLNVFDFDLMDVAEALIAKAKQGVKVTVGIDKGVIEARPEVKAVFDRLSGRRNVTVYAVESVGLNHQKMIVRDWSDPKRARTLFSSGNLTQSCIGPEGDAVGIEPRPEFSVPNANHMVEVDGQAVALAVSHILTLTLDPEYRLKGRDFPLTGAFKVFGPAKKGDKDPPYLVLTFSPNGGLGDVNRDITRRVLLETRGPVRMLQFAFSSAEIEAALVERAKLEKKEGGKFDFKSVGDTPFAMRPWSVFLKLSGLELKEEGETKEYVAAKDNPMREALGKEAYEALLKDIRVGPSVYKERQVPAGEGKTLKVNAKIHHKVLISGDFAVAGTSFNFSENANSNNEQFVLFKDPAVVKAMNGVVDGLFHQAKASVAQEAARRNELFKNKQDEEETRDDAESRRAEEQIKKGRQKPKGEPGSARPLASGIALRPVPLPAAASDTGFWAYWTRRISRLAARVSFAWQDGASFSASGTRRGRGRGRMHRSRGIGRGGDGLLGRKPTPGTAGN